MRTLVFYRASANAALRLPLTREAHQTITLIGIADGELLYAVVDGIMSFRIEELLLPHVMLTNLSGRLLLKRRCASARAEPGACPYRGRSMPH